MASLVVLITGSSRGIGKGIALHLARDSQRRFKVYATMRTVKDNQLKTEAGTYYNDTLFIRELDVTKQETIDKTVKAIVENEGRLDVLVNNAGQVTPLWWENAPMESFYDILEVNYFGCVRMTKAVVPYMKQQRSGRILQLSSALGVKVIPLFAQYISSKFALEGFSESIAPPLRKFNICISVINIGIVQTDMASQLGSHPTTIFKLAAGGIPDDHTSEITAKMLTSNADDVLGSETQTVEDIATFMEEVILSENPDFRYTSSATVGELARRRLVDPTGKEMMDTWLKQ